MASQQLIYSKLATMAVIYNRPFTAEEFQLLTDVWGEIFADVEDKVFAKHCDYYMKENKTFPTPAHLLTGCQYDQSYEKGGLFYKEPKELSQ